MRLEDVRDYLKLRGIVENPWEVLRFRKGQRPGQTLCVRLIGAPPLYLRGGQADHHMFHRIFLRDEYRLAGYAPGCFDCVLDLGGNVGVFAARAALLARRVISFEPSPEFFSQLRSNVETRKQAEAVQNAVAGEPGTLRLYRPRTTGLSGASSAYANRDDLLSQEFDEVPCTSLDAIFRDYGLSHCDLVKIDIEGKEYEALQSASPETLAAIDRIHGEYHDVEGDDPSNRIESLESFLRGHGFGVDLLPHRKKAQHGMFFAARPEPRRG